MLGIELDQEVPISQGAPPSSSVLSGGGPGRALSSRWPYGRQGLPFSSFNHTLEMSLTKWPWRTVLAPASTEEWLCLLELQETTQLLVYSSGCISGDPQMPGSLFFLFLSGSPFIAQANLELTKDRLVFASPVLGLKGCAITFGSCHFLMSSYLVAFSM